MAIIPPPVNVVIPHQPAPQTDCSTILPGYIYNPALPNTFSCEEPQSFLQKFLNIAVSFVLIVGVIYFFFTLIMGGIRWITSSGDKAGLEAAQKQVTHAFVGLAILFASFAIIKLIGSLFGIDLLNFNLPTI